MNITQEALDRIENTADEIERVINEQRTLISSLKDQHGERQVTVDGPEDKKVSVTEKTLWQEMFQLGVNGNRAADYFREKYPRVFELHDKLEELKKEQKALQLTTFGFTHDNITLVGMIRLMREVVKLEKKGWISRIFK